MHVVGFVCFSQGQKTSRGTPSHTHPTAFPLELSLTLWIDEFSSAWSAKCKILCNTFLFNLGRHKSLHTNSVLQGLHVGVSKSFSAL